MDRDLFDPQLAIHVFLDNHSVCIRSFTDGVLPYMEYSADYDETSQAWLDGIDEECLNDSLMQLFQGIPEHELRRQRVMCSVMDSRSKDERNFIFKSDSDRDSESDSSSCDCGTRSHDLDGIEIACCLK